MTIIRKAVAWSLLAMVLFYMLTGFGIMYWNIVSPLTLGLLGKASSFQLHTVLWIPFILLLVAHVTLGLTRKR
jgi:thiosulfate reductase cytochrome b subunit